MLEIRWHGRGGQGAFTASKILGAAAVLDGKYALAFPSFGPERRGAPIQAYTKISEHKITDRTVLKKCDYIIYLDESLYQEAAVNDLKEGGRILINSAQPEKYHSDYITTIDADRISSEIMNRAVSNTAMVTALVTGYGITDMDKMKKAYEFYLPSKVVEKNKLVADQVERLMGEVRSENARTENE